MFPDKQISPDAAFTDEAISELGIKFLLLYKNNASEPRPIDALMNDTDIFCKVEISEHYLLCSDAIMH